MKYIRNFAIIAHIDHGKSTFADRIIQYCGGLSNRQMESQVLDSMDIERERGITIKAQTASLSYRATNGIVYNLNLIDTPGHVDFTYEVNRSLAACEGALLLVDATQGVEAQTVASCNTAIELGVQIIPVINKIDLPTCNPDRTIKNIENILGIEAINAIRCSAKTGLGVEDVLSTIVHQIPSPKGNLDAPLQALIIDSWFNNYVGVVILVRIFNGILRQKDHIKFMMNDATFFVEKLGIFTPHSKILSQLYAGQVGFVIAGIKVLNIANVGDTLTLVNQPSNKILCGFKRIKPQVFAGLYLIESHNYEYLRNSLLKLKLNDAALQFEPEFSNVLGVGFRCGFLGLLHMEIIQQRLEREFKINLLITAPTVIYKVQLLNTNTFIEVENPSKMPELSKICNIFEPIVTFHIYLPPDYIGAVILLCTRKRGIQISIIYYSTQVHMIYEMPMSEIITDFFNKLKSITHGYASMDYEFKEYRKSDLVKVSILLNNNLIDSLSFIIHRSQAQYQSRLIIEKICTIIPRQMFDIILQAAIGTKIIARESIKAIRKNVLAKCYGGDITRKKKLLEKQKEGKKRMKRIGNIEIPKEAFFALLHLEEK